MCIMPVSHAQETDIAIRDVQTGLRDNTWYLSARVDYQLNRQMLDALQNGIGLTFSLQVEVNEIRNWLPDAEIVTLQRDYELSWQPPDTDADLAPDEQPDRSPLHHRTWPAAALARRQGRAQHGHLARARLHARATARPRR